jgi:hypothetical protein
MFFSNQGERTVPKAVGGTELAPNVFNLDQSSLPQNEETIAVDPSGTGRLVGGANDYSGLPEYLGGLGKGLSGYYVSSDDGKSVLKAGSLPSIVLTEYSVPETVQSGGDPVLDVDNAGNFFYASLYYSGDRTAVVIGKSINSNLFGPSPCDPASLCWDTRVAYQGVGVGYWGGTTTTMTWEEQAGPITTAKTTTMATTKTTITTTTITTGGTVTIRYPTFEDKDWIAVDRSSSSYSGSIYVTWTHFSLGGTSILLSRCTNDLACTVLYGPENPLSGGDSDVQFSMPYVDRSGNVYVVWMNLASWPEVQIRFRASQPGGASFGDIKTIHTFEKGGYIYHYLPYDDFRIFSQPKIVVDTSSGGPYSHTGRIYVAWEEFDPSLHWSSVRLSYSDDGGNNWQEPIQVSAGPSSTVTQPQAFFPTLSVDSAGQKAGMLVMAYYSTQFDGFAHRYDVMLASSVDGGSSYAYTRATDQSNEPDSDPFLGGVFIGDYFQIATLNDIAYVHYNANYATKQGWLQQDNYLAVVDLSGVVVTTTPDFVLSITPTSKTYAAGETITFEVSVQAVEGFSEPVTLSVENLPNGYAASFDPPTVVPSGKATLKIATPGSSVTGTQTLLVMAKGGEKEHTTEAAITGQQLPPASPCVIATAALGSVMAPLVQELREFREKYVLRTFAGSAFLEAFNGWYYSFSPYVATSIASNDQAKAAIRMGLYPLLGSLQLGERLFPLVSVNLEVGVLIFGFLVCVILGTIYIAPLAFVTRYRTGRKRRVIVVDLSVAILGLLALALGEALRSLVLAEIGSVAFVISSILAPSAVFLYLPKPTWSKFGRARS